jgi:ribosome-binding protein aMBF1 (putative translation factor)
MKPPESQQAKDIFEAIKMQRTPMTLAELVESITSSVSQNSLGQGWSQETMAAQAEDLLQRLQMQDAQVHQNM